MPFSWDDYPYTNFHELNLDWFINKFKEIFDEWSDLYNTMVSWKADTESDLETWESGIISNLNDWKDGFETLFSTTFNNLTQIKTDAEDARDAAQGYATSASGYADAAEASAASVANSAAKIDLTESALEKTCVYKQKTYTLYVSSNKYYYFSGTKYQESSSKKYISTRYVNATGSMIAVEVTNTDFEYCVHYFDSTGSASTSSATGYLGHSNYKTGIWLLPKEAVKFILTFRKVDDTALTSDDIDTLSNNIYAYHCTDETLTERYKSADSQAVGDLRDSLDRDIQSFYNQVITPTWQAGGINSTSNPGANTTDYNDTRIRCAYTNFLNGIEVTVPDTMTVRICTYDSRGGAAGFQKWLDSDFWNGTKFFNFPPGVTFRIQAQLNPVSREITVDDGSNITIKRYSFNPIINSIPENSDLNDYITPGIFTSQNTEITESLDNCPLKNTSFKMIVEWARYTNNAEIRQTIFKADTESDGYFVRYYTGSSFGNWDHYIPSKGIFTPQIVLSNVKTYSSRTNDTVKARYRIGEYNVAHYRMSEDNPDYLSEHEIAIERWRKWIQEANLDFLFLCEDSVYIDSSSTKQATDYLYNPYFNNNNTILHGHRILTKLNVSTTPLTGIAVENVNTNPEAYPYYYIDWIIVPIENVGNILMAVIHNFPSGPYHIGTEAQVKENRARYYNAIKQLLIDQTGNYDYVIIAGDTNVGNYADPTNANRNYDINLIETMCDDTNCHLVNGDEIGWFKTVPSSMHSNYIYDNIILSNNIRVEKIECNPFMYEYLYSDHVPVIAEISLL